MTKISHTFYVRYTVRIRKKASRIAEKMPPVIQERLVILIRDLEQNGAIRKNWPNFSELGKDNYHCHLSYHWVACWHWEKNSIEIEVYYAGSRENAPY